MRTSVLLSVASFLLISLSGAYAAEPRAFVCKFPQGVIGRYDGRWSAEADAGTMEFTFASLNNQKGSAEIIGNAGASTVRFWKGVWMWNFVEITDAGAVMTTTVFEASDGQNYPAVHSRHTSISSGTALPSQYRGMCTARF